MMFLNKKLKDLHRCVLIDKSERSKSFFKKNFLISLRLGNYLWLSK